MGFQAEVLRVLIASPSDVKQERDEIEAAVFEWNKRYSEELKIVLLPGRWEEDVVPTYHGSDPQKVINEQLVNKCDILIGVFWTKLGTATRDHSSGTLEEVSIFIERGKEVMLYFLDKDVPRQHDYSELHKVDEYKREYSKKGIYAPYNSTRIIDHLYRKVIDYKNGDVQTVPNTEVGNVLTVPFTEVALPEHSKIASELLETDKLNENEILLLAYTLDTGIREFGVRWMTDNSLKLIKSWEEKHMLLSELSDNYAGVISNLAERGLIEVKEETSHGNVRLYIMPIAVYDELRILPGELRNIIDKTINSFKFPF